ncbi:MAG TPA: DUF6171 family protein [Oscillospiraceae bacterium]|nr:DUF6171 family protein [Oscillospiraceae bacterium]HPF55101.1 DUF6171 family protein [Clostridiales bacterium]HPK34411.1 DUF6171 family protein [Oscillospiraceae bacterium]HPR75604.1 DUF6171 family protein [Oscillospiraceae bacterium]
MPCRCLLQDGEPLFETVAAYLASLPEELKADEKTVQARLAICARCDCLWDGICRKCGCYVQARAAKKDQRCPHEKQYWPA